MTTGTSRCPSCDEPISEGTVVHRCTDRGEQTVLDDRLGVVKQKEDQLGETIAYQEISILQGEDADCSLPEDFDDGFPAVDDLIHQTLGQYKLESVVGRGS